MKKHSSCLLAVALSALAGCGDDVNESATALTGGDPGKGRVAIERIGCPSCHTIPRIRGANALVGPPLDRIASRTYIAGVLGNSPENMMRWLHDPPAVDPRTAMPNLHLSDTDVRDIASFLYTLR